MNTLIASVDTLYILKDVIPLFEAAMNKLHGSNIKAEAHKLVDSLSDNATWEDLRQKVCAIELGLADLEAEG